GQQWSGMGLDGNVSGRRLQRVGQLVVTPSVRGASASEVWAKAGRPKVPGSDIDHIFDLQLGGADDIANMSPLDASVNRSLGPQIAAKIKQQGLSSGDLVCKVTIGPRKC
ncbi:hypothetical protein ACFWFF_37935, partial [Streptomyces sp. NPDC060223]|uniref:hypothetical protein n=1 Tax=Streptomyces sp. NPDC060223 TaxID=3347077 RepID=UPI0036594EA0